MTNINYDFQKFFSETPAGSSFPWADGTLRMNKPVATYEGPDGIIHFDADTDLETLYAVPAVKKVWDAAYGQPFPMALTLAPFDAPTVEMADSEFIRVLLLPESRWLHPRFLSALELAARVTAKKYPADDDRKDQKFCIIQGGPAPGLTLPDGAHRDTGEQADGGYYCKDGADFNYTQYAVSGGPLPTQIWDGWNLTAKFDHERTGYFFKALRLICPAMTAIMDADIKGRCGLTKDWIIGDPTKGSLLHWQHNHIDIGFQRNVDQRFASMTFYEAYRYIDGGIV